MNPDLATVIGRFAGLNVLVLGEAILDSYLDGRATRLCREAPVPVVDLDRRIDLPGGAANVAANAAVLGARVTLLSMVGVDPEGALLSGALAERGVATEHLIPGPARQTLAKHRLVVDGQTLARFDQGSTDSIDADAEAELIGRLSSLAGGCDALIVSDYGAGMLTPGVVDALTALQERSPRLLVVDAKDPHAYRQARVTAVKPNYSEAIRLLGLQEMTRARARVQQVASHGERLLDLTGAQIVAVTLDADGALLLQRGLPPYRTYAAAGPRGRASGAGDTFLSALALALAAGAEAPAAAELASAAAGVVVREDRTAVCSADALRARAAGTEKQVTDVERLAERVSRYREERRRIVFTNGCFDILHSGHIALLNRAKALGDVLIVGVNTDDSVRRLKGQGRPINALDDRLRVLGALSCVDQIVAFAEDTPSKLIRVVRPDVFVKGGDYTRETLPEASLVEELGGVVQILAYTEDRSTTGMIERIRRADVPDPPLTR